MRNIGKFDINIDVSPSVAVLEQIERNMIMQMMGSDPSGQTYTLLAPILAKTIKTPHAKEMEARLNFLVPPHILAAEQGKQYTPPPDPQSEMAMQQMQLANKKIESEIMEKELKAQNDKLDSMAKQLNAIASVIRANTSQQDVEIKKEIAEDALAHKIIDTEANLQHKEKVLVSDMLQTIAGNIGQQEHQQIQPQPQEQMPQGQPGV